MESMEIGTPAGEQLDDALAVGQLLIELIHVVYATRESDAGTGTEAGATPADRGSPAAADQTTPGPRPSVSPHAIRAAMFLWQGGPRTIGELAEGLGISMGWASRVVSELEATGMVVRSADPSDRRIVRVSLSAQARSVVQEAHLWRAQAIDRALDGLAEESRAAVRTFLGRAIVELTNAHRERRSSRT